MPIPGIIAGATALFPHVLDLLDKVIPNEEEREKAKRQLLKLEQQGELRLIEAQLSAIIAEANSEDPWTSRARPTFLYVVYLIILAAVPMGFVAAVDQGIAFQVAEGFRAWLGAIPEPMWWLFGTGYLGYTGARTYDKHDKRKTFGSLKDR